MKLLEAGDAEKARTAFSSALELDETHVPSRLQLAHLHEASGDWSAAVRGFTDVIALDPGQVEALVRLAHLVTLAKDYPTAKRHVRRAFDLAPDDAQVLAALALVYQAEGDAGAATDWSDRALAVDPANWTARLVEARLAADAGEFDTALDLADALLAERPADMDVNILKMRLLSSAGREAELRTHVARMADRFPDLWIKEWLAELRQQAGDTAGAYAVLKELSGQQPGDVRSALDVVDIVRRSQGAEAARKEFAARIAAADPSAALQLRLDLADLEVSEGHPEEAVKVLSALIAEAPNSVAADTARIRIAGQRLAAGERDEARRVVDEVLERDPRRPDALALRASLLLDEGDAEEAIRVLRVGLDEAPDDVWLILALAHAYSAAGRPELAIDQYETAARTSDFDPNVVTPYAEFLLDTERTVAAIYLLESAARRHPDNTELLARLETARSRNKVD